MPVEWAVGGGGEATFVKVRPYWFNIERSMGRLLRLLYRKSGPLGIVEWNTPLVSLRVRSSAAYILLSIAVKCLAVRMLSRFGTPTHTAALPDCGDLAMFSFPAGVRIFDLDGSTITNIGNGAGRDAEQRLARMLDHQESLGESGVAPRILGRDSAGDSYREEMCEGARLKSRAWWRPDVFDQVVRAARAVQQSTPATYTKLRDAVGELQSCLAAVPESHPDPASRNWLAGEIEALCSGVDPDEETEALLSHGDLARRNLLVRPDGRLVLIDWQTVDFRSRDYDVYNYHFSIAQAGDTDRLPESTLFEYLHDALGRPDRQQAVDGLRRFRLDFVLTRLKYFLLPGGADASRAARVVKQMQGYADCFGRYERWIAAAADAASQ